MSQVQAAVADASLHRLNRDARGVAQEVSLEVARIDESIVHAEPIHLSGEHEMRSRCPNKAGDSATCTWACARDQQITCPYLKLRTRRQMVRKPLVVLLQIETGLDRRCLEHAPCVLAVTRKLLALRAPAVMQGASI